GGPLALLDSETSERRSIERTGGATWRQKVATAAPTSPRRTGEFPCANAEYRRPCENWVDSNLPGGRILPALLYRSIGRRGRGRSVGSCLPARPDRERPLSFRSKVVRDQGLSLREQTGKQRYGNYT